LDYLFSPQAIRDQSQRIYQHSLKGLGHFLIDESKINPTVDFTLAVIKKNYPDLDIPFHARWRHFQVGSVDRLRILQERLAAVDVYERARAKLDLAITSVLLDAGAGKDWSYLEPSTQKTFARSEGLAVASFYLFIDGILSGDKKTARADQEGLNSVSLSDLQKYFQVTDKNPLVGLQGRLALLNNLAKALENKKFFKNARPGNVLDYFLDQNVKTVKATDLLNFVLRAFGSIWPGRLSLEGVPLGDVWMHQNEMVPFHKLSQWLTYSLIEPIAECGLMVSGVEELTGLAEYRNGGLMVDAGILRFTDTQSEQKAWEPSSELVVEWRALTVYFLDLLASQVQRKLQKTPAQFPLAKVLEGGTWWAGRTLAFEKRGGEPPVKIISDGTVF
jgi:hypothetical protein